MVITPDSPPYLQVALDTPDWSVQEKVLEALPKSPRLIIEAGTPLIKRYGIDIVGKIRTYFPNNIILADLKTLDVGRIEVDFTADAGADAAVVSGLASPLSIDKFLDQCKKRQLTSVVDMMEVEDPIEKLKKLTHIPNIVLFHRGIDTEDANTDVLARWKLIPKVKQLLGSSVLTAVAGGLNDETAKEALKLGADILIVGRYITAAEDIRKNTEKILSLFEK